MSKLPNPLVTLELNGVGCVMTVSKHVPINEESSNAYSGNFIRCMASCASLWMLPFAWLYEMRKVKLLDSFGASVVIGLGIGAINTIATSFFIGVDAMDGAIGVAGVIRVADDVIALFGVVAAAKNFINNRVGSIDDVNKYLFTATADAAVTTATIVTARIIILSKNSEEFISMTSEGSMAFEELIKMSEKFPCMKGWNHELEIRRSDGDFLELKSICKSGPILGKDRGEVVNYVKDLSISSGADFSYIGPEDNYGQDDASEESEIESLHIEL